MTLDELQAAFEAGQIHENTFVCREGSSEWLTLAEVAGLGDEEEEEAPLVAPVLETRPTMPSRRPDAPTSAAPVSAQTRPPMPGAGETRPAMPSRRPEMNTVPAARFQTAAAQSIAPATSSSASPLSFAPVTSNIDLSSLDMDELALRPKRRWGLVLAAAAALAVAGGGTVFALGGGESAPVAAASKPSEATASQRPASPTLSEVQKPSEPAAPTTAEPAAPEAAADAPKSAPQFSDDMKEALLAADKGRVTKKTQKLKARAAAPAPRRAKAAGPSSGFKSSGSAYDPLNGKL